VYQKLKQYRKALNDVQKAKSLGMKINETRFKTLVTLLNSN